MPTQDQAFIDSLQATFKVEAEEHLQAISTMLLELEKSLPAANEASILENVYRAAHSLKGAARAVDLSGIESICQALESVFSSCKHAHAGPSPEAFDTLHHALDKIRELLASPQTARASDTQRQHGDLINRLSRLHARGAPPATNQIIAPQPAPDAIPPQPPDPDRSTAAETVRISLAKLDAGLLQAEDMLTVKTMTAQRATDLRETITQFDQWRKQWSKVSSEARSLRQNLEHEEKATAVHLPGAPSAALVGFLDWNRDYFRSLENKLTTLAGQAEQDRHSVTKRVSDLLEDSKKLLMLPFSTLAAMFPKLVRDLCRDQNKDADLAIVGGEVEIDKRILEEMKDALIHILRNCVDHGVEKPAERLQRNKLARATITIAVSPANGNKVEILVSDDGAGVDVQRVKDSAVRHGVIADADARALADPDALSLIFQSGVSASPIVTTISGRGLGMAIVRAKTEKLGGRISVQSTPHVGTTLRMLLPLTMATFRGILVQAADRTFVLPTVNVERVLRIPADQVRTVENRQTISLTGRPVALTRLDTVLGLPPKKRAADNSAPLSVAVLQYAEHRIAFVVDEVLHEEEVLVKPLRKPLLRVRNIAGATVLGSGKAVPILHVADLMKSARLAGAPPAPLAPDDPEPPSASRQILVVEDSVTSRMLLKGILESAGHHVRTAVDGLDALTALRESPVDLVVSDVEMPRMNGFDLTAKIRADKRLAELPVVLVTALETPAEKERGIDAGASAYIVKSTFDRSDLLEVIARLL